MINKETIIKGIRQGLSSTNFAGKVIVVGAGIAGITACQVLRKSGLEVTLLEASNNYGGRIRSLPNFTDVPIELGAEWVHGKDNVWYELLHRAGYTLEAEDEEKEDYYFFEEKIVAEPKAERRKIYQQAEEIMEAIEEYEGSAQNAADFANQFSKAAAVQALLNAWLGNEYGTSHHKICLEALRIANEFWPEETTNFRLKEESFYDTLAHVFPEALSDIALNAAVKSINYTEEMVYLKTEQGVNYEAERVVLALPLGVLQQNYLSFTPSLPDNKQEAIRNLGIDTGLKLILKFSKRFWEDDLASIFGVGIIPEIYPHPHSKTPIMTAYVMGDKARYLQDLGENKALERVLAELTQMFGKPINDYLEEHLWQNWGQEPFVRGVYSFPSQGDKAFRRILQNPIRKKIFFAGEACHQQGHYATVHGAIETGYRAAEQILRL